MGIEGGQWENRSVDVSTEVENHDEVEETDDEKDEQALGDYENNTQSNEESPVIPERSERT